MASIINVTSIEGNRAAPGVSDHMSRLTVSIAISPYDHVRDLTDGRIKADGLDLVVNELPVEEIFFRTASHREWDVCEFSFGKCVALRGAGDTTLTALPVFPSRMFRQSSIFVTRDMLRNWPESPSGFRSGLKLQQSIYADGSLSNWELGLVKSPGSRRGERTGPGRKGLSCTASRGDVHCDARPLSDRSAPER